MHKLGSLEFQLQAAARQRLRYHAPHLVAVRPTGTGVVRVTQDECPLDCAHCGGHYLKPMKPLADIAEDAGIRWKSLLVSGACDKRGVVPILPQLATLQMLAKKFRINLHPGYILDPEAAQQLAGVASVFSCDFVGDETTLQAVYGLRYSVMDLMQSLQLLARYGRVVPHVCIGLAEEPGFSSEYNAIRLLAEAGFTELVIIVFIPTRGTRLAHREPPLPQEVGKFLAVVGQTYPQLRLTLGCMRPPGRYREEVDRYAVLAGVNSIVKPSPQALQAAADLGLGQEDFWECCCLYGDGHGY